MIAAKTAINRKCYKIVCKYYDAELEQEFCSTYFVQSFPDYLEWLQEFHHESMIIDSDFYKCRLELKINLSEVRVTEKEYNKLFNPLKRLKNETQS